MLVRKTPYTRNSQVVALTLFLNLTYRVVHHCFNLRDG